MMNRWIKIDRDYYAHGFSTKRPENVHGIHGPNDLIIMDDAQGITDQMTEAIENVMAGGNTRILALCNPAVLSGIVYDAAHSKRRLWNYIRISAFDTPNVQQNRIVIPGMITHDQVKEWEEVFGKDSNFYRVKVLAEFPLQEPDTLIPLPWIERAMNLEVQPNPNNPLILGVDVAWQGDDDSSICPLQFPVVMPLDVVHGQDTVDIAGRVIMKMNQNKNSKAFVDIIGMGAGVENTIRHMGLPVVGVNVSMNAHEKDRFVNLRSEIWWLLRSTLDPSNGLNMSLPRDMKLMEELSVQKWKPSVMKGGRIAIAPKEQIKKVLKRSPDRADSLCLATYGARGQSFSGMIRPYSSVSEDQTLMQMFT